MSEPSVETDAESSCCNPDSDIQHEEHKYPFRKGTRHCHPVQSSSEASQTVLSDPDARPEPWPELLVQKHVVEKQSLDHPEPGKGGMSALSFEAARHVPATPTT